MTPTESSPRSARVPRVKGALSFCFASSHLIELESSPRVVVAIRIGRLDIAITLE